jgi:hypothetical protein
VAIGPAGDDGSPDRAVQVVAVSTPGSPAWRWRIVDYAGVMIEESRDTFASIGAALVPGAKTLREMNITAGPRASRAAPSPGPVRPGAIEKSIREGL